jgi:hypothetical protein
VNRDHPTPRKKDYYGPPASWKLGPQPSLPYARQGPYCKQFKSKGLDLRVQKKSRNRNDIQWDAPNNDPMEAKLKAMVTRRNAQKSKGGREGKFDFSSSEIINDPFIAPLLNDLPTDLNEKVDRRDLLAEKLLITNVPAARRTHLHHIFGGGNLPATQYEPLSTEMQQSFEYGQGYQEDVKEKQTEFSREHFLKRNGYTEFNEARLRYAKLHNVT